MKKFKKRNIAPNPIKRAEIIIFIADYLDRNGQCPTIDAIGKGVGLKSKAGVWHHLERMGLAGLNTKGKNGLWLMNKREMERELTCPTCQRPLFGTVEEWQLRKLRKEELLAMDRKIIKVEK